MHPRLIQIAALWLLCCSAAGEAASLVGKPAPPLAGVDLQQQAIDIGALRGRSVLVMFWATWCGPCREEMPFVQAAFEKYRAHGFSVIAVNVGEEAADAAAFMRRFDLTLPVTLDRTGDIAERFRVIGLPTNYLVDADGIVREQVVGKGLTAERLEQFLRSR